MSGGVEQRDAADEGRLEQCGSIVFGTVIVNEGEVVRPSQLIASVRQTRGGGGANELHSAHAVRSILSRR